MKFKSYCRCGMKFIPDNRHVSESGRVEDCTPSDNLEYLEMVIERKELLESLEKKDKKERRL